MPEIGWFASVAGHVLSSTVQVFWYNRVHVLKGFIFVRHLHAEHLMGGKHKYKRVLPGALRGFFTTLLSAPQCHAALSMMPYTLVWIDNCSC
jgi:hypothetical protein